MVDLQLSQRVVRRFLGDDAVIVDLRKIAHAAKKPVRNTRRASRARRDLMRARRVNFNS